MKKEIKLLSKSIDHWFENLMMLQLNQLTMDDGIVNYHNLNQDIDIYIDSCALCQEYVGKFCVKCPIYLKVNHSMCRGTPWAEVNESMYRQDYNEIYKAITDFLNFLIELKEELTHEKRN